MSMLLAIRVLLLTVSCHKAALQLACFILVDGIEQSFCTCRL